MKHSPMLRFRKLRREERVLRGKSIEEEKEEDEEEEVKEEEEEKEEKGNRWGKYIGQIWDKCGTIFWRGESVKQNI